jgi:hypothetical protein
MSKIDIQSKFCGTDILKKERTSNIGINLRNRPQNHLKI